MIANAAFTFLIIASLLITDTHSFQKKPSSILLRKISIVTPPKEKFISTKDSTIIADHKLTSLNFQERADLIGEEAATFSLEKQSLKSWGIFAAAVSAVLGSLFYLWIWGGGPQLGDEFKLIMESLAGGDSTLTIVYMLGFFAVIHSGLASLRPIAEPISILYIIYICI